MPDPRSFSAALGFRARRPKLPPVAQAEIERCCLERVSTREARERLAAAGAPRSMRTVGRLISIWRAERRAAECRANAQRLQEIERLGVGIGAIGAGLAVATETLSMAAPAWREAHAGELRAKFEDYLSGPSAERFTGLVVGAYVLLISASLERLLTPEACPEKTAHASLPSSDAAGRTDA